MLWRHEEGLSLVSRTYLKSSPTNAQSQCWEMEIGSSLLLNSLEYGKSSFIQNKATVKPFFCTGQDPVLMNSPQFWLPIQDLTLLTFQHGWCSQHTIPSNGITGSQWLTKDWKSILLGAVPSRLPVTERIILYVCIYRKHMFDTFT